MYKDNTTTNLDKNKARENITTITTTTNDEDDNNIKIITITKMS
jgi:hypothetical protein